MEKIRCFIAVPISSEVREGIENLQKTLRHRGMALKWVPPQNLHFTLKFLGDIDPGIMPAMGEKLIESVRETEPFTIEVGGFGAFPNLRAPRVFWVGLKSGTEPLVSLARQVSNIVREFPTEADNKPFKPHLTIGRVKDPKPQRYSIPDQLIQVTLGEVYCDRMILMQSQLKPSGAEYTPLVEAQFAK